MNNPISPLCHINDITDGESKGFHHQGVNIIAIRKQQSLFLYQNSCPHLGVPLEWQADQFLNHDKSLIQCNTHGALFEIESGRCVSGPCNGAHLKAIAFTIKKGNAFIKE
jgi:nitrite reductase/ring-hydroxylating ferredoxin subunit